MIQTKLTEKYIKYVLNVPNTFPVIPVRNCKWERQNVAVITLFVRNTKQYNSLSYISLKILPQCNYILLPADVKLLETFLEVVLRKPFQLFRRILNDVSSITKMPSLQCLNQSKEQVKISWSQVRGCSSNVTLFFAKKRLIKTDRCAGALL